MTHDIKPRSAFPLGLLALLACLGLAWLGLAFFRTGSPPDLAITPATQGLGRRTPVTVRASERLGLASRGLASLKVELLQDDRVKVLAEKTYAPRPYWAFWGPRTAAEELKLEVGRDSVADLVSGKATIRVTAGRAGTPLRSPEPTVATLELPVRLTPPTLGLTSIQNNAMQGGSEVVLYRVGPGAVRDGVKAGDWFFPGFPLPGGALSADGSGDRFCLYGVPYDLADPAAVRLIAEDEVGNVSQTAFIDRFTSRPPTSADIQLSDAFLAKAVPEILAQSPEIKDTGDPLQSYLAINGELRKIDNEKLRQLATTSKKEFLWREPFRQLGNSQVMASFADHRSYLYQGKVVDHQYHLGFDLASTKRAPVTAANRGVVAFAGYLGIYGNAVVLDHGYGLATLYAHLSSIDVQVGQEVDASARLGASGETGLAAGDHLHFSVLLDGLAVTPVEWWDGKWIRDHLKAKLGGALPFSG